MRYLLKVDQDDATQSCAIFIDREPIAGTDDPDGVRLELASGEHTLTYDVSGPGAEVEIALEGNPEPKIIIPSDGEWPFAVAVPDDRTGLADRIYFIVGEGE